MRYAEALAWLYGRQRFGVKLGLDAMRALLERLNQPQEAFDAIHVTGTNGKGSTSAFLESCLRAAGHRVGLYTSPHLVSFRERIRVAGEMISEDDVVRGVLGVKAAVEEVEARRVFPTYFECVTALAFEHFRRQKVPVAVVEVGMGGRLDATNLCRPLTSVVTNVGLDHTDRLGTSVQAIAAEKAGILRPGVPAVTAARREALDVMARKATQLKVPLKVVRAPEPVSDTLEGIRFRAPYQGVVRDFGLRMLGAHQVENALLALTTLEQVQKRVPVDAASAEKGLAQTVWPGRLELVDRDPVTLLDGAHNAPAMQALCDFLGKHFPEGKVAACIGVLRDKDATRMLRSLSERVSRLVLTEPPNPRALRAVELEENLPPMAPDHALMPEPSQALRELFSGGNEPVKVVTGSLFLVGEARAQLLRLERDPPVKMPMLQ